jgi:hypothetical protein
MAPFLAPFLSSLRSRTRIIPLSQVIKYAASADSLVLASTGLRELLLTQSSCHISLRERESHLHRDLRFTNLDGYFRF